MSILADYKGCSSNQTLQYFGANYLSLCNTSNNNTINCPVCVKLMEKTLVFTQWSIMTHISDSKF